MQRKVDILLTYLHGGCQPLVISFFRRQSWKPEAPSGKHWSFCVARRAGEGEGGWENKVKMIEEACSTFWVKLGLLS